MVAINQLQSEGFRSRSSLLVVFLWLGSVMCQLRPDYSDLPGKYCETRPEQTRCCTDRVDDCGVPILGTVCYCDQFCDRGLSGDCCPDYFALCLNETQSQVKGCVHNGKYLRFGEIVMDNCNPCACSGPESRPAVVCGTEPCLVDPALLTRLEGDAARLGWSAANHSQFWGRSLASGLLQLLGTDRPGRRTLARTFPVVKTLHGVRLPSEFDSRRRAGWAALIGAVSDQGWCGGSWAVSAADTASDRLSLQTGGRVALSAQQLLDCAPRSAVSRGCRGGRPDRAWAHLRRRGVGSAECRPYRSGQTGLAGRCRNTDSAGAGSKPQCRPVYRMQPPYRIASREKDIRHEIFTNGPVQALLRVEPDFFLYRSGVYRTSRRGPVRAAYHSVRLLGWGTEVTGTGAARPYWLAANSWGTGWGEEGLFRIRRGANEADIETFVVGAWPRTHRQRGARLRETADERQKSGRTSQQRGDQRSDPEGTESPAGRDEERADDVEASGEAPTDQPVVPESGEERHLVTSDSFPTGQPGTAEGDETEHLVTQAEEETDGLLTVDEKQPEYTSDIKQISDNKTSDEKATDPVEEPSAKATGYTTAPEEQSTAPNDDYPTNLTSPGETDADRLTTAHDDPTDRGPGPTIPTTETEDEQLVGKREQDSPVVTPDKESSTAPTAETGAKVMPAPKTGGYFEWLDW